MSRPQLLRFTANLRVRLIGMEACSGSHFLGRRLREQGHEIRLIPAQYVKPYVKTNKNDYIDAEAIAEAVGRPTMRFVPIKSDERLDMQSLHRVRDRWVARRTSVINQIRGLLLERGITFRKGRRHAEACLPGILEDADNRLSGLLRMLLAQLQGELRQLQSQIDEADALVAKAAREHEPCQRLMAIPGIGPLTATAVVASIGSGAEFRKGRSFAQSPGLNMWLGQLASRAHTNIVAVARAKKMARLAWAVLAGYICADQTVIFIFRLRQGGGPYIPNWRLSDPNAGFTFNKACMLHEMAPNHCHIQCGQIHLCKSSLSRPLFL